MIEEAALADMRQLSPRAAIALLSLQLRAALHEATELEAEADAIDVDAALWQLRSRLTPLIEDRRRALEAEAATERELAAERIAAAHVEAERIIAEGHLESDAVDSDDEDLEAREDVTAVDGWARSDVDGDDAAVPPADAEADVLHDVDPVGVDDVTEVDDAVELDDAIEVTEHRADVVDDAVEMADGVEIPDAVQVDDVIEFAEVVDVDEPVALVEVDEPVDLVEVAGTAQADDALDDLKVTDPVLAVGADPLLDWAFVDDIATTTTTTTSVDESVSNWPSTPMPPPPPKHPGTLRMPLIDPPSVQPMEGDVDVWKPTAPGSRSDGPSATHVTIDAEAFARAFAAAIGPLVEARQAQNFQPPMGWVPPQATPAKRSFWAHAWHPDVLLSGLAMVIVVIVLIAWTG